MEEGVDIGVAERKLVIKYKKQVGAILVELHSFIQLPNLRILWPAAFTMGSTLRRWDILIVFIILNSYFQSYAISQSFGPGTFTDSKWRTPLALNNTPQWNSSTPQWNSSTPQWNLSSTPQWNLSSTPQWKSSTPFSARRSSTPLSSSNFPTPRTTPIPTSTSFQSLPTTSLSTIAITSQSSLSVPSTTSFSIFTTSTLTIDLNTNIHQSSTVIASTALVTNPGNPDQVVTFRTLQIPQDERDNLPIVTDTTPAALIFPNLPFPVLLFPYSMVVFPMISSPLSWLLP